MQDTICNLPPAFNDKFVLFALVMMSCAVVLTLILVVLLAVKMNSIQQKLDEISSNASEFLKMGVKFFREKS